ncbi:MAG TPA: OmpA family protein [Fibrella sp.]
MMNRWIWGPLIGSWLTASVCIHLFYIKRIRFSDEAVLPPVSIIDGAALHTAIRGNLFSRTRGEVTIGSSWRALDMLANYLLDHPDRQLTITGYHTLDESRQTLAPNLGALRADKIWQYLRAAGVSPLQVQTRGVSSEALVFVNDTTSALAFTFAGKPVTTARTLAEGQQYIDLFHPMELYFPTGSTAFIRTPDTDQFMIDAARYWVGEGRRIHPNDVLLLTGHTDSVGSDRINQRLSLGRARAVQLAMQQAGLPTRVFRLDGRGESQPIAPNATPEGREANRRVTIVVQKKPNRTGGKANR